MPSTIEDIKQSWEPHGTRSIVVKDDKVCGLHPFIYTWAILVGMSLVGYERRYCYGSLVEAHGALNEWDGVGHPAGFITMK